MPLAALLNPILIAGATAAIGSYFQNRSAQNANERNLRASELITAKKIYEETNNLICIMYFYVSGDGFYAALRKGLGDTSREAADTANWMKYEQVELSYRTSIDRVISEVEIYFGPAQAKELQSIHHNLEAAAIEINRLYWGTKHSMLESGQFDVKGVKDPDDLPKEFWRFYFDEVLKRNSTNSRIKLFSKMLMFDISKGTIGALRQSKH